MRAGLGDAQIEEPPAPRKRFFQSRNRRHFTRDFRPGSVEFFLWQNRSVISADGPRITTWINGVQGLDYTEADPKIPQSGKIGFEVHGGGKALVQVKHITIEELPAMPKRESAAEARKSN